MVAVALKVSVNRKRQFTWRYIWKTNQELRNRVSELLEDKTEDHGEELQTVEDYPTLSEKETEQTCREEEKALSYETTQLEFLSKYDIVKIVGDGNCLFRCLAFYRYGNQEYYSDVRKEIVDFVSNNWSDVVDTLLSTCDEYSYTDVIDYENRMGANGAYGTDFELGIFVQMHEVPVTVFRKVENEKIVRIMGPQEQVASEKRSLILLFSGDQRSGHWEILQEKISFGSRKTSWEKPPVIPVKNDLSSTESVVDMQATFSEEAVEIHGDAENVDPLYETTQLEFLSKYDIVKIVGDGNCLFRCLAFYRYGHQEYYSDVRKEIVDFVTNNWSDVVDTLLSTCDEYSCADVIDYENRMGANGAFGTDFELGIFVQMHEVPVTVFRKVENEKIVRIMGPQEQVESKKRSLILLFSGAQRSGHWEILQEKISFGGRKTSCEKPPVILVKNDLSSTESVVDMQATFSEEAVEIHGDAENVDPFEFTEDSEKYDSDPKGSSVEKVVRKKGAKKKIFTEDICLIEIPSTRFQCALGTNDTDKIREVIEKVMRKDIKCSCTLSFYGSIRYNLADCVAYAKCKRSDHEQRYQFKIAKLEESVAEMTVSSDKPITYVHKPNMRAETFRPLKGAERRKWQQAVKHQGVTDFFGGVQMETDTEMKDDGHMQDLRTLNVIYKAKSEERCKNRLVLKSSDLSDLTQLWIEENKLQDPFLRQIGLPLTAIMFSKEDLDAVPRGKPTIFHMDATGSIARRPQDLRCKRIFYYCIVMKHDLELLTIAQMITSEHGVASVSTFLKVYKDFVMKCERTWPLAQIITIDWSWAFMHALLHEWNNMDMKIYLNVMYAFCTDNVALPTNITILKSCFGHFVKRVSQTIKRKFRQYESIKTFILECMCLMSVCRTISQLDELFRHVCKILCSRSDETACESILAINAMLKPKSSIIAELLKDCNVGQNDSSKYADFEKSCEHEGVQSAIYRNSPFFRRYNTIMAHVQSEVDQNQKETTNKYYAPKFIEYAVRKYLAYAVLWVSLDIDFVDPTVSRVSNAYVESAHRVMKEIVFEGTSTASIADRVRQLKTARKTTMAKILLNVPLKGTKSSRHKLKYPATSEDPFFAQETWKSGSQGFIKKKGHLHAKTLHNICEENIEKLKQRRTQTGTKEKEIDRTVSLKLNEIVQQTPVGPCENISPNKEKLSHQLKKFKNGVVEDINYYMASRSSMVIVGKYRSEKIASVKEFWLTTKQYSTLKNYKWIDGVVMDCFAAANVNEWCDFSYIPTDDTILIIGDWSGKRISTQRRVHLLPHTLKEKILMPYLFQGHWRLLVASTKEKKLTLIDPYGGNSDFDRVVEAFKLFISHCGAQSPYHKLKSTDWQENSELDERPYQKTNDGHSCGVYIMYYMKCLGSKEPFDMNFNPVEFRLKVAYELLSKSESMEETCLSCFKSTVDCMKCDVCSRQCHEECLYKLYINSDDDDEEEQMKRTTKKRKIQRVTPPLNFTCKLCRTYFHKNEQI